MRANYTDKILHEFKSEDGTVSNAYVQVFNFSVPISFMISDYKLGTTDDSPDFQPPDYFTNYYGTIMPYFIKIQVNFMSNEDANERLQYSEWREYTRKVATNAIVLENYDWTNQSKILHTGYWSKSKK